MSIQADFFTFAQFGDAGRLQWDTALLAAPGPEEIQIRHLAIGVNYIDLYHRRGVFAAPLPLPSRIGVEGVGEVLQIGENVAGFNVGDRIAYVGGPVGAYSTARNLPAARAVKVPAALDNETVAALIFKGLTVDYLINRCCPVKAGETVLFHAAAGGVGSIAVQWLHDKGATVIGTVGSAHKAKIATANGCDHVVNYRSEDFAAVVKEITAGRGADAAFDSVGADTFQGSMDSLRPRGTLVSFGETSGPVAPLTVATLGAKGSLFLTRPSIAHYTADRHEYGAAAANLFGVIEAGIVKPGKINTYRLSDARKAQQDLEDRKTMGSVVLIP